MIEEDEFIIDDLHTVNLLLCVLNQLPEGCSLWAYDYIYSAFEDGWLLKLQEAMKRDGLKYLFELTPECIYYLEKELLTYPEFIHYFCHYGIIHEGQSLLRVFDETTFIIDPRINIPESLIHKCNEHDIYVYKEIVSRSL